MWNMKEKYKRDSNKDSDVMAMDCDLDLCFYEEGNCLILVKMDIQQWNPEMTSFPLLNNANWDKKCY